MFLPLILNRRFRRSGASSETSDVISRMPNFVREISDAPPSTSKVSVRSYRFGFPICAGHHSRGLLKLSWGYCSGEKVTSFDSPAANSTGWANSIFSILPFSVPFTRRSLAFLSCEVTVRWAALFAGESTLASTAGLRTATGPLVVRYASRHKPIFLSGGAGFQSTKVIARLFSVGAHTCTARVFVPVWRAEVMLNSYVRHAPATSFELAICFPFRKMLAR